VLYLLPSGFAQTPSIIPEPASGRFTDGKFLKLNQINFFCQPGQEYLFWNFISELNGFGFNLPESKKSDSKKANLIFKK